MSKPAAPKIRFKARLQQPETPAKGMSAFLVLPTSASVKLPTRSALTVEGTLNGQAFRAVLQPDGKKSHWLSVDKALLKAAAAGMNPEVTLEMSPSDKEIETPVPPDLRKALSAAPEAKALWSEITPIARRDWIQWIASAKQAETRARRINSACDMLAGGKKRVCCFDRSGFYAGNMSAPKAKPWRQA
ncbi:MAG: YdeI/OmpD-associated family protein [Pseudomonadota bacterium]